MHSRGTGPKSTAAAAAISGTEPLTSLVDDIADYAIFMLDPQGYVRTWNKGAQRIKGYAPEEIIGSHFSRFYPKEDVDAGKCELEIDVASRTGRFEDEGWRVRKDGTQFWANVVLTALKDESGRLYGFAKVTRDLTAGKQAEENARKLAEEKAAREAAQAARRLAEELATRTQVLQTATSAFGEALSEEQVFEVVARYVLPALGADSGSVALLSSDSHEMALTWSFGYPDASLAKYRRFPLTAHLPHAAAVRTRTSVFLESQERIHQAFPELRDVVVGALASMPLLVGGRCIGVLGATFTGPMHFPPEVRDFGNALAAQCAQALDRARAFDVERKARARLRLLADASRVLSQSLEYEKTLEQLVRLVVPELADWCTVDVLGFDSEIRRVAVAHPDPERAKLAIDFQRKYPATITDAHSIGKVIRTGVGEMASNIPIEQYEQISDPVQREHSLMLRIVSYLCVPLVSRGRVLGALTFAFSNSKRGYTDSDVTLAEDLAARAAASLDNALLYQEAKDAIRARDSFLSVASHELNTPLTSIKLNFQSLARTLSQIAPELMAPLKPEVKLQTVDRQLSRLGGLVRDLLDVSRITSGGLKLEPREMELTSLVREVITRTAEDALRAGCVVQLDAPEPVHGVWDRLRLDQVVTNLLSNALKYGHGHPVQVTVRRVDEQAVLSVQDHGIGIAQEDLKRLFQRFERIANERHYSGWGLGLWIVKQVLDAMGGTIHVESTLGAGTTFSARLPLDAFA